LLNLGTLGGTESQANGVNRGGLIVGWSRTASGEKRACLWRAGRIVDVNSLAAIGPDARLVEAAAINDVGQLVADGSNGHAYLITLPAGFQ
jgi:probable HAF family extracellular repeat protein